MKKYPSNFSYCESIHCGSLGFQEVEVHGVIDRDEEGYTSEVKRIFLSLPGTPQVDVTLVVSELEFYKMQDRLLNKFVAAEEKYKHIPEDHLSDMEPA